MKKIIFYVMVLFAAAQLDAQVIIGGQGGTLAADPDVSLQFADNLKKGVTNQAENNLGFILPWITDLTAMQNALAEDGTMIYNFDASSADQGKVMVRENGAWKALSDAPQASVIQNITNNQANVQSGKNENAEARVVIGDPTNETADGILVLSDTDKAMILPRVGSPHNSIENPAPGMMVFDTDSKLLAVFNGEEWTFWKGHGL